MSPQPSISSQASALLRRGLQLRAASDALVVAALVHSVSTLRDAGSSVEDIVAGLGGLASVADGRGPRGVDEEALLAVADASEELAARLSKLRSQRLVVRRPEDVAAIASAELRSEPREVLLLIVCDSGNRVVATLRITEGSADRLLIPVRETLIEVLAHRGRAFALAHNHPSGDATPSPADVAITQRVRDGAGALGLRFLGHVVITDEVWKVVG